MKVQVERGDIQGNVRVSAKKGQDTYKDK